jgi:nitrogen fixation protein FixH
MVLICLVAFFAVVVGVNAVMIGAAVSTFGGVETEGAYQAGLAFARESVAAHAQDALNWRVQAKVRPAGAVGTLVEIDARDANDRPLTGLHATARLVHPTDKRADQAVTMTEIAPGSFRGTAAAIVGQWNLFIELSRDGPLFRSKNRIVLR